MVLSKNLENFPLYPVQQALARFGEDITRTTLADRIAATATALEPLPHILRHDLMAVSYLQIDEAPVRVMDPEVVGRAATDLCPTRRWGDLQLPEESWSGWSGPDAEIIYGNLSKRQVRLVRVVGTGST